MTTIGVYAGSFDPVTLGHLSIIDEAALAFDQVIVAVGQNSSKGKGIFDSDKRQELIRGCTSGFGNVRVVSFQGLLANYCAGLRTETKKVSIVRGLRAVSDFESEMAIAALNRTLAREVPTVFFPTGALYAFVSSSAARELGRFGSEEALREYVPPKVAVALLEHYGHMEPSDDE